MSQTIPLVSVEHCAHQSVSAAPLRHLQRLQQAQLCQAGNIAPRPSETSLTVKACIQTLPSLRVIWTSTGTPSHCKCFCSWWPSHLPWPSSELSCQSFMSQMHLQSHRVKHSSYSPLNQRKLCTAGNWAAENLSAACFRLFLLVKERVQYLLIDFISVIQFSSLFGWSLFVWFSKSQWFKQNF